MLETAAFSIRMLKKWQNNSKNFANDYTAVNKYYRLWQAQADSFGHKLRIIHLKSSDYNDLIVCCVICLRCELNHVYSRVIEY